MKEQYIDFRNHQRRYELARSRFLNDPTITERNKEIVMKFCRDASLGKTLLKRARKKISVMQLTNYFIRLSTLIRFVQKDLDKLEMEDMERFIEALENDEIRSRGRRAPDGRIIEVGRLLSANYKRSTKITIRKFYKWLWGRSKIFPELVEWIDTHDEPLEVPALTEAEIEQMIDFCSRPHQRALIQVLFDAGLRTGELLNIRLRHVRKQSIRPDGQGLWCYVLRVPYSKTRPRTIPLPMPASERLLSSWLHYHPAKPTLNADGTLSADDLEMQLFPFAEESIRHVIRNAAKSALRKTATPTLMRHSSATYWANKLSYFQICKRFGWSMTSKMPQRYIDRPGVQDIEAARIYHEGSGTLNPVVDQTRRSQYGVQHMSRGYPGA